MKVELTINNHVVIELEAIAVFSNDYTTIIYANRNLYVQSELSQFLKEDMPDLCYKDQILRDVYDVEETLILEFDNLKS